jgi:hypothetical protein
MKNPSIQNDRILDFLNGDVKSSSLSRYFIKDEIETIKEHRIREYDRNGSRTKTINYNEDGNVILEQISEFNFKNFKIGYRNFDGLGIFDSSGKYEINSRGNIISKFYNDRLEETYKYDAIGRILEQTYCSSGDEVKYEYAGDDKFIISQKNYQNGICTHLLKYKNDENGNILNIETYRMPSYELRHKQVFIINEFGDELESYVIMENGDKSNWYKYDYKYDLKGNWIIKKIKTSDDKVFQIIKREIEYYNSNENKIQSEIEIEYLVSNFNNASSFIKLMKEQNYNFKIYDTDSGPKIDCKFEDHESIWIGSLVPLNDIKIIIKYSNIFYPHLKYIKVFFEDIDNNSIYIGGSTSTAVEHCDCIPLDQEQFDKIQEFSSLNELYLYLSNFSKDY